MIEIGVQGGEDPLLINGRAGHGGEVLDPRDAAVLLGVDAVCGFVGRNQSLSMDQNLEDFGESFVPLLKEAKVRGLTYRVGNRR